MYNRTKYIRQIFQYLLLILLIPAFILPSQIIAKGKKKKVKREICLSFDELPYTDSFFEEHPDSIMGAILDALKKHKVKAIGFVVGENIGQSYDLLGRWLNEGNRLGSMTFSRSDLNDVGLENFFQDVIAGKKALETMLSGFGQKRRYFRYPYLHCGTEPKIRKLAKSFIADNSMIEVPATVVVEDYLYNLTVQKWRGRRDSVQVIRLLNEYVNYVLDEVEATERTAKEVIGRRCRHILQLRANELNALYLDDLITALKESGFTFITVDQALKDKLYRMKEAYYGPRGLGYIDRIKYSDPDLMPAEERK